MTAGQGVPTKGRKKPKYDKPQQVTRIPPYRPGMWVKMRKIEEGDGSEFSEKVRRVRALNASITSPDQKRAVWRVFFDDGNLEWHGVERFATDEETRRAMTRLS